MLIGACSGWYARVVCAAGVDRALQAEGVSSDIAFPAIRAARTPIVTGLQG
jgi:hypothetical protein